MSEQPNKPDGVEVQQVRVYYSRESGEVIHVHTLVVVPGERLEEDDIRQEMSVLEESLRERHESELEYLIVDEADLQRMGHPGFRTAVDVSTKRLLFQDVSTTENENRAESTDVNG
jgi:hypothetical protein